MTVLACLTACVHVDPDTGKTKPRGEQYHDFADVERKAKRLQLGMTKLQVLQLLGSPAEKSRDGTTWLYLPERPAVLIPGRALRLEFEGSRLAEHGYRAIVLGKQL